MRIYPTSPWSRFVAVAVVGIGFFLMFKLPADSAHTLPDETAGISSGNNRQTEILTQTDAKLPVRISIPSGSVDANIEYIGLTPEGAVDAPKNPATVAWFNLSPRPGEIGNSVLVGHSGWKENRPAVFDTLFELRAGDKIYVVDAGGETLTFIVRELHTYTTGDDTSAVFTEADGKAHLVLITCEGDWNKTTETYSARLAIFADME